jgi:hypothetical protein
VLGKAVANRETSERFAFPRDDDAKAIRGERIDHTQLRRTGFPDHENAAATGAPLSLHGFLCSTAHRHRLRRPRQD